MSVLLTGANGFIGQYFMAHYQVQHSIKPLSLSSMLSQNALVDSVFDGVDVVVHLSALVHQMGGANRADYWRINVDNTIKLAQLAKKNGVCQFVFMSTIKVFGEETPVAYHESSPTEPKDDYGRSKLAAEQALLNLEDSAFKVAIIRTPVVYGTGVKANIAQLVKLVSLVKILPFAGINNKRTLVYIGNLCAMIDKIITQGVSGIFLAGDDDSIATSELIRLIAKHQGKKIILFHLPLLAFFLKYLVPKIYQRLYVDLVVDNTISKQKLAINKQVSTDQGIRLMLVK